MRSSRAGSPGASCPERSSEPVVPGLAELQAAYETLSDEERRRRYDDELGGAERPQGRIKRRRPWRAPGISQNDARANDMSLSLR